MFAVLCVFCKFGVAVIAKVQFGDKSPVFPPFYWCYLFLIASWAFDHFSSPNSFKATSYKNFCDVPIQ